MRLAIDIDDDLDRESHEVDDVRTDRLLAPESNTDLPAAQTPPKQQLGVGRLSPHLAGTMESRPSFPSGGFRIRKYYNGALKL